MTPRKILITGAAGFVGWHLAMELSSGPGYELTLADNFVRGRQDADLATLMALLQHRLLALA